MSLPLNIDPCPIIEAVVEIRFSTDIYDNAVFGIVYDQLTKRKKDYQDIEKLPILQLPDNVLSEFEYKNKPHYKISNGKYNIQIGPNVLTVNSPIPYIGWSEFYSEIRDFCNILSDSNVVQNVNRLGIRYINFFDIDMSENVNLSLIMDNSNYDFTNTIIRTQITEKGFANILQIANGVKMQRKQNGIDTEITGSIIDIDTYKTYTDSGFFNIFENEISQGHIVEKEIFFSLLKANFIKQLQPKYENE